MTDPGNAPDKVPAKAELKGTSYTTVVGDSFNDVALRHGVSLEALLKENEDSLKGTAVLPVGTKLKVPARKK